MAYFNKNPKNIKLGDIIGTGCFSVVQIGVLERGKKVAVKTLIGINVKENAGIELSIMAKLSHRNVLKLIGAVAGKAQTAPRLIFEYMENGNLNTFVSKRHVPDDVLMGLCHDIACGMDYLHEMQYIHRDLAGRNVLVDSRIRAKVADFGMSRFMDDERHSYYKVGEGHIIPLRWAPKESIPCPANNYCGKFVNASDVWSFGVTVCEAWTEGGAPYRTLSMTSDTVIVEEILNGKNPTSFEKPKCPAGVTNLLEWIFQVDYTRRPSFAELKLLFGELRSNYSNEEILEEYLGKPRKKKVLKRRTDGHYFRRGSLTRKIKNDGLLSPRKRSMESTTGISKNEIDKLAEDIHDQVWTAGRDATFSIELTKSLEKLTSTERMKVIFAAKNGCAPLLIASRRGNLHQVEYLVKMGADLDQFGDVRIDGCKSLCIATPLWSAAVGGHFQILQYLHRNGADVNLWNEATGSTPVRSACSERHDMIVDYLVKVCRADIHIADKEGSTCLMAAVHKDPRVCEYLLRNGAEADINAQNRQGHTALQLAVRSSLYETTKVLLSHGADPFIKDNDGDDALQLSCLKRSTDIFRYLLKRYNYSLERQADMLELMGAKFMIEPNIPTQALNIWREAIDRRCGLSGNTVLIPKIIQEMPPSYAKLSNSAIIVREFKTHSDWVNVSKDWRKMRVTALLISERILGSHHNGFLFRLRYIGGIHYEAFEFEACARLWRRALELQIEKDSGVLGQKVVADAQQVVLAYLKIYETENSDLNFNDLLDVYKILVRALCVCSRLIKVGLLFQEHKDRFDCTLSCSIHLLHLLLKVDSDSELSEIKSTTVELVKTGVRLYSNGETFSLLSVGSNNVIQNPFDLEIQSQVYSNVQLKDFLIDCGAGVDTRREEASGTMGRDSGQYVRIIYG